MRPMASCRLQRPPGLGSMERSTQWSAPSRAARAGPLSLAARPGRRSVTSISAVIAPPPHSPSPPAAARDNGAVAPACAIAAAARGPDGVRVSLLATTAPDAAPALPPLDGGAAPLRQTERFDRLYSMGDILGCGTYGTVRSCKHLATGEQLAVKVLHRRRNRLDRTAAIANEAEMAHRVRWCASVVRTRALFEDAFCCYIVQDLVVGGSLQALVDAQGGRLSEAEAAAVLAGVLDALVACHAEGICYGDVKPANFMLASAYPSPEHLADPSRPKGDLQVRIVDFGCARACPADCSLEGLSGTPAYMAPEVAAGQPYGPASDLWGAGVLLYQLLTGRFPYWDCTVDALAQMGTQQVLMDVSRGTIMLDTPSCRKLSPPARALLAALFERDPTRRVSAHAALRHPWMAAHGRAPTVAAAAAS
ncbi:MAG: kinase-like domain-containing protein [Monoraphidium minutum]|nr:MAG: kinase-like domain-containing protein [Monoraphidium minutum]